VAGAKNHDHAVPSANKQRIFSIEVMRPAKTRGLRREGDFKL
jgi:hypothetical protein